MGNQSPNLENKNTLVGFINLLKYALQLLLSRKGSHSLKVSIFWHSAFFMVQLSHPYMTATSPSANQRSATSPSANQRIVHSLITNSMTRIPHPAFKGALLKPLGSSEVLRVEATHLLAWPCNKPFSAPNSSISLCLASLSIRHMNLH